MRTLILKPGDYLLTREAMHVSTVLGSCVSVILYCRRTGDAGICHAMLTNPGPLSAGNLQELEPGRYLERILPLMLAHFASQGCKPAEIHAKVFGGASITRTAPGFNKTQEVGIENINKAFALLHAAGIPVRASNTGGNTGHHILLYTETGEVLHRMLKPTESMELPHHA